MRKCVIRLLVLVLLTSSCGSTLPQGAPGPETRVAGRMPTSTPELQQAPPVPVVDTEGDPCIELLEWTKRIFPDFTEVSIVIPEELTREQQAALLKRGYRNKEELVNSLVNDCSSLRFFHKGKHYIAVHPKYLQNYQEIPMDGLVPLPGPIPEPNIGIRWDPASKVVMKEWVESEPGHWVGLVVIGGAVFVVAVYVTGGQVFLVIPAGFWAALETTPAWAQ